MKVVILAGGFGTRISEESHLIPKPMIQIGDMPILWHIMKQYSHYGFNEFVICGGYKQHVIKEFFADYYLHRSDITFDFSANGEMTVHTNFNTMTGGRVKRVKDYIGDEPFFLTYGDGVSDVDIGKLLEFHKSHGKMATLTAIKITARFGVLDITEEGCIQQFREKTQQDGGVINGGFMVLEPSVIDLIEDDSTVFEKYPLEEAARRGELMAYPHDGFWQCMDTLRDKNLLESLWAENKAPWKVW